MRFSILGLMVSTLAAAPTTPLAAQDLNSQEIMVTGSRIAFDESEYD